MGEEALHGLDAAACGPLGRQGLDAVSERYNPALVLVTGEETHAAVSGAVSAHAQHVAGGLDVHSPRSCPRARLRRVLDRCAG